MPLAVAPPAAGPAAGVAALGGFHNDLPAAWTTLDAIVAARAPEIDWAGLRRLCLFFDDQVNHPADCCRSSLGFVVAERGTDAELQAAAAAWRAHPLVTHRGLHVACFPAGECLATQDLPCRGPPSYLLCLIRALHGLRTQVRRSGVHAAVPGLLQLRCPRRRTVAFLLPLDRRAELLPFAPPSHCTEH
ncbi:testis-expressed sequence 264 -like [Micractinium conductrix]|uniref:Testis-expressed sequence 264 -like n=1 Tax=Micractinium conductrix TaxID=554055 RepID=A0A2P6VGB0_9CHLO|nr:testis-expressed sequence 264 -like [Micractinium conductrix]|eukprot:PSC73134.1 testis-expressed sequence 264 -like [Micractinium conductrix]